MFIQFFWLPTGWQNALSDTSEAQRSSPQSHAGCAPQLSGFKLTHGLFFSFYSFLEMPELFPMGKHAKARYSGNSSTPSEAKSIPILCLQRSQSMSKGEHLSSAILLLPGSWGCSQALVAGTGLPWDPHLHCLLSRAQEMCPGSAWDPQSLLKPCCTRASLIITP